MSTSNGGGDDILDVFRKIKKEKKPCSGGLAAERLSDEKKQQLAQNLKKEDGEVGVAGAGKPQVVRGAPVGMDVIDSCDPRVRAKVARYSNIPAESNKVRGNAVIGPLSPSTLVAPLMAQPLPAGLTAYKIPKKLTSSNKLEPLVVKTEANTSLQKTDEWGDPIVPKKMEGHLLKVAAAVPMKDEWGDDPPIIGVQFQQASTVVASVPETDDWGEPIAAVQVQQKAPTVVASVPETDDWGEPIAAVQVQQKAPTVVASVPEKDDWGEPIAAVQVQQKAPTVVASVPETDEWGDPIGAVPAKNDWGVVLAPTTATDDWGPSPSTSSTSGNSGWGNGGGGYGSSNGDSGGRGRGRGRGRGGGSGTPRTPREGDWDCPCGANNFQGRRECFKCKAAIPAGLGGSNTNSFGGGAREGGWDCPCGANNFPGRRQCFKCKVPKPVGLGDANSNSNSFGGGGWDCPCGTHNYESRRNCLGCKVPKPAGLGDANNSNSFGGGRRASNNPNFEPVTKRAKLEPDDWGTSSKPSSANASNDDWGTSSKPKPSSANASFDDWGTGVPKLEATVTTVKTLETIKSNVVNVHSVGNSVPKMDPKKPLKEWVCPDTRCGNPNFDWREDCFRCGTTKPNTVLRDCVASSRHSLDSRTHRQLGDRPRLEDFKETRSLHVYSPPISPVNSRSYTSQRIKAPPDEKNLKRMVVMSSSGSGKKETATSDASTETPKEWSYGGHGIEDCDELTHNVTNRYALPLSYRFEAAAQNPGGGISTLTLNTIVKASPEVLKEIAKFQETKVQRTVQMQDVQIEAPKTRSKINSTWRSLHIIVNASDEQTNESEENGTLILETVPATDNKIKNQIEATPVWICRKQAIDYLY